MHKFAYSIIILFFTVSLSAQVVWTDPVFFGDDEPVTVYYDATEGTTQLSSTFPVYFHTGVVTSNSTPSSIWQHVVGTWGSSNSAFQMQLVTANTWKIEMSSVREFYNVPNSEEIYQLAFVFRNSSGTLEGKGYDGGDIFVDLKLDNALDAMIVSPAPNGKVYNLGETVEISAASFMAESLKIFINGEEKTSTNENNLEYQYPANSSGTVQIIATAYSGVNNFSDTVNVVVQGEVQIEPLPNGVVHGINYINSTTVTLALYAPNKQNVYVIGDFNDWIPNPNYFMKKTPDGNIWWLTISGLTPQKEYAFQYLVDGEIRIGDPYSEKILDPWNDQYIDEDLYPNLMPYPHDKTNLPVSVLQTDKPEYEWEIENFEKPKKTDLVIYELLLRDFIEEHSFAKIIDSLDYLERLGINALQLMPIMEFEGNESWGYNPMFMLAVDKYYGPANELKRLIDECHKRGIAVILDIVLNHQFGQSPLVRLYQSGNNVTAENPWFNTVAKHPFNVGYDMNHETDATKYFVDRVTSYWVEEFKIDGYRFDLSKGFTQTNSGSNVGLWGQYDASRIALLKRMADVIWDIDPSSYLILEHFADNNEEKELANYGFMLWGNMNHEYNEASMGYNSNLNWGSYKSRGWNDPHLITYMESHDEERLMFKNIQYGNSSGDYNVKNLNTALNRMKTASAFFYTIPGPKMLWQFGELGYDFSINYPCMTDDCRLSPKPIRWDYYSNTSRKNLYKVTKSLIEVKKDFEVFETTDYSLDVSNRTKRIQLNHSSMNVTVIGNFDVSPRDINPNFQTTGKWYDFFSGDSFNVSNTQDLINLQPGEFFIYSTKKLPTPEPGILTSIRDFNTNDNSVPIVFNLDQNYPNPFNPTTSIKYSVPSSEHVSLKVFDILGREIAVLVNEQKSAGTYTISFDAAELSSGVYFYRLNSGNNIQIKKMLLVK
ncbi:MAG: T9SS type A sorting domain-containing protein [Melioribacteraceae bacterium]|nr:T9SS type A sorting domain-containing protein [Melioribacteraceae bacterium]